MDHAAPGKEVDEFLGGRQTQVFKLTANDGRIGASTQVSVAGNPCCSARASS
jgi:hypothetical protein